MSRPPNSRRVAKGDELDGSVWPYHDSLFEEGAIRALVHMRPDVLSVAGAEVEGTDGAPEPAGEPAPEAEPEISPEAEPVASRRGASV